MGGGDFDAVIFGFCFWLAVLTYILIMKQVKRRSQVGSFWRNAANWSLFGSYLSLALATVFVAVAIRNYF